MKPRTSIKDFTFIGASQSRQGKLSPASERHDEALDEAWMDKRRR
jgi:hypothetical protein